MSIRVHPRLEMFPKLHFPPTFPAGNRPLGELGRIDIIREDTVISATGLDPRHLLYWVLSFSAAYKEASALTQTVTETLDAHACWKTNAKFGGIPVQIWIDSGNGLPVCLFGSGNGKYFEFHYSQIPIDFTNPDTQTKFLIRLIWRLFLPVT